MAKAKKGGLGRGLSALIPNQTPAATPEPVAAPPAAAPVDDSERIHQLDPRELRPNPQQPRTIFDEDALEDLANSIRNDGVQEPVIVRRAGEGYELVSGERRCRASVMADLDTIPAVCREVSDSDLLKLGLIENIQREDLGAIELAHAYQRLVEEFDWTQEELAQQVGKKRATVANTLRLLGLPVDIQEALTSGTITMGHARALLALPSPNAQSRACRRIVKEGMTVRQVEKLASPAKPRSTSPAPAKDPNLTAIEDDLRRRLGTKVTLRASGDSKGKIEIEYFTLDDLERVLAAIRT